MKRGLSYTGAAFIALLFVLALTAALAMAQSGGYDLTWHTIDSGGGYAWSTGGGHELGGTVGQPGAGTASGGQYTLTSGFWISLETLTLHSVYLPLVVR